MGKKKRRNVIQSKSSGRAKSSHGDDAPKVAAKSAASKEAIEVALMKHFLFKVLDKHSMESLIGAMTRKLMAPGEVVIKQGDDGDTFYVMEKGEVSVVIGGKTLGTIKSPAAFGELALMYSAPRAATLTCTDYGVLWVVDRANFKKTLAIAAQHGTVGRCEFLQQLPEVSALSNMQITRLAESLVKRTFADEEDILQQGLTNPFGWCIVWEGAVLVRRRAKPDSDYVLLAELEEGHFFGERSLLRGEPCGATVTAQGHVTAYVLDPRQFAQQLVAIKAVKDALTRASDKRDAENKHRMQAAAKGEALDLSSQRRKARRVPEIRLEDIDVIKTIGAGTMGRVKLVRRKSGARKSGAPPNADKPNGAPPNADKPNAGNSDHAGVMAMKCFQKAHLVGNEQVANVVREKTAMSCLDHPFVMKLLGTGMDADFLYMFLELVQGGELWSLLYQSDALPRRADARLVEGGLAGLPNHNTRWFAAGILAGLEHVHDSLWVYRDMKLENLLCDAEGYVKIVDFGFAKRLPRGKKTQTLCGTPEYFAPELVLSKGHDRAADLWAFGIVIYELMCGRTPFADDDQSKIFMKIVQCMKSLEFPRGFPRKARSLIKKLLRSKPGRRIGMMRGGCRDILQERWFTGIDWGTLAARKYAAPWRPELKGATDTKMFEKYEEDVEVEAFGDGDDAIFEGFVDPPRQDEGGGSTTSSAPAEAKGD
jgi:serine/threonine protein kinase